MREQGMYDILVNQLQDVYDIFVNQLFLPNTKQWDEETIFSLFDHTVAEDILNAPLVEEVGEVCMIWKKEHDGEYSIHTGYILWRHNQACLLARTRLRHHYVQCLSACQSCEVEEEDDCHMFFLCMIIRQCWRSAVCLILEPHLHSFHDTKSIILYLYGKEDGIDDCRFAVLIDFIWKLRNNMV